MANGDSQPQYTDDQIRAAIAFAGGQSGGNVNVPQSMVDAYRNNPSFLNALTSGGVSAGAGTGGLQGAQSVGGLMNLIGSFGGGGGGPTNQQQQQGYIQGPASGAQNPLFSTSALGANVLGQPLIENAMPNQGGITKGGIYSGPQLPTVYGNAPPAAPSGLWNTTPGVLANQQQAQGMQAWAQQGGSGNPADAAAIEKAQGMAPGSIAKAFYSMGGQQGGPAPVTGPTQGGASTTPTPVYGGVASATAPAPQPWARAPMPQIPTAGAAVPPPAPGGGLVAGLPGGPAAPDPFVVAHNSALADAGKALYAHYGGDPNAASPTDIANFHSQLTSAISGGATGAPTGAAATGAATALASGLSAKAPVKMQTGGFVPSLAPIGMANGGSVSDDDQPPEVRHKTLTTKSAPASTPASPTSSSSTPSSAPAAQGGLDVPNAYTAGQGLRAGAGGAPNIGSLAGEEAYVTGEPVSGVQQGPSATQQTAGVISNFASGLSAAAQKYAESFKPWQWQGSAIPAAPTDRGPAAQFSQQPSSQGRQQQQQVNPYLAAMYGGYPYA